MKLSAFLLALSLFFLPAYGIYIPPPGSIPLGTLPPVINYGSGSYSPVLIASAQTPASFSGMCMRLPSALDNNYEIYGVYYKHFSYYGGSSQDITFVPRYGLAGGYLELVQDYNLSTSKSDNYMAEMIACKGIPRVAGKKKANAYSTSTIPYLAYITSTNGKLSQTNPITVAGLTDKISGGGGAYSMTSGMLVDYQDTAVASMGAANGDDYLVRSSASGSAPVAVYTFKAHHTNQVVKIGNFHPSPYNEIAYTAYDYDTNSTILEIYQDKKTTIAKLDSAIVKTSGGKSLMPRAVSSLDCDSDGYDEIIMVGGDSMLLYGYSANGYVRKAEYIGMTGLANSTTWFVGTARMDKSGKEEIVAIQSGMMGSLDWDNLGPKTQAIVMRCTGSKLEKLSASMLGITDPTKEHYTIYTAAALGDMSGDGKEELALSYHEVVNGAKFESRLQVYNFTGNLTPKDTTPPKVTIVSPTGSSFYNNTTLVVVMNYLDTSSLKSGSARIKIYGTAYDSGWKAASTKYAANSGVSYGTSFSLLIPAGNYTILAEASDSSGNKGSGSKTIALKAPSKSIFPGTLPKIPVIPLIPGTVNASNATNASAPEPEAEPQPLPEEVAPAGEEVPPAALPEEQGLPEEIGPVPSEEQAGPLPSEPGTIEEPPATAGQPSTDEAKAAKAVADLEVKIEAAKGKGADTSAAEDYLAKAQQSYSSASYSQAVTEAGRGTTLVDAAMKKLGAAPEGTGTAQKPGTQTPSGRQNGTQTQAPSSASQQPRASGATDYTPYYVAAGAIVILGVAYMLTHRTAPQETKKKKR